MPHRRQEYRTCRRFGWLDIALCVALAITIGFILFL